MTLTPGQRICVPLLGKTKISGNIAVVINEQHIEIHISQNLKSKKLNNGSVQAVDFGYTEVMTDTEGTRYGEQFGKILTKASDDLHKKMQKRNKLHALQKKSNLVKAKNIKKYNLGRQKQLKKAKATRAALEREINTAINELIHAKKPALLITEDLSHTFSYNKPKTVNRRLSSWLRGKIQERISFKALTECFRHEQVNPAFGSQTCPICDFVDSRNRIQDRFKCSYCEHEGLCDRIAAMNYARRYGDEEIGRYTPYRQVKTILLERFHRRLELERSKTVPGRTLKTVQEKHPPILVETMTYC
jgi:putative transposase